MPHTWTSPAVTLLCDLHHPIVSHPSGDRCREDTELHREERHKCDVYDAMINQLLLGAMERPGLWQAQVPPQVLASRHPLRAVLLWG